MECTAAFVFDNLWLARFHLAKLAVLGAAVLYQDDQLRGIYLSASCYGRQGGPPYIVVVKEAVPTEWSAGTFTAGGTTSEVGRNTLSVHLTPTASPEQRSRAYAFNLYFLDHLGPCKDANDILPGLP